MTELNASMWRQKAHVASHVSSKCVFSRTKCVPPRRATGLNKRSSMRNVDAQVRGAVGIVRNILLL